MSIDVRLVWLCAHSSSLRAQSSHWSINAAVMGTLPELHYEKKEKNTHCICCKDGMMLQDYAEHTELLQGEMSVVQMSIFNVLSHILFI